MSKKRRTKKQKIKAKKQTTSYKPSSQKQDVNSSANLKQLVKPRQPDLMKEPKNSQYEAKVELNLFRYDKKLIYKDLLKSLLITLFIFALLLGIFFWLK